MSNKKTLFEKFGGSSGIHEMAFGFHQKLLRDSHLRRYFRYLNIDDFVVLHQEFFEIALGRQEIQNKKTLEQVRHSFVVSQENFPRFTKHILDTLEKNGLEAEDRLEVQNRVIAYIETLTAKSYRTESNNYSNTKAQYKGNNYESCSV